MSAVAQAQHHLRHQREVGEETPGHLGTEALVLNGNHRGGEKERKRKESWLTFRLRESDSRGGSGTLGAG